MRLKKTSNFSWRKATTRSKGRITTGVEGTDNLALLPNREISEEKGAAPLKYGGCVIVRGEQAVRS